MLHAIAMLKFKCIQHSECFKGCVSSAKMPSVSQVPSVPVTESASQPLSLAKGVPQVSHVVFFWLYVRCCSYTCSTSLPSGNQVDGLPLVVNTRAACLTHRVGRNISVIKDVVWLNFSGSFCQIATKLLGHLEMVCILPHAKGHVH